MEQIRRIMRPTDVPDQGLLCDLLWSDPDKDTTGWGENDRGVSFTFGIEVIITPTLILYIANLVTAIGYRKVEWGAGMVQKGGGGHWRIVSGQRGQ